MKRLFYVLTLGLLLGFGDYSSKFAAAAELTNAPAEKEVATYLIGAEMSAADAKAALEGAGFEVIAEHEMKKIGTTLVFTNEALKAMADKPNRGYAAIQRLFVDEERKQISITNPVYFGRAFMQEQYDHAISNGILEALHKAFPGLSGSADKMAFDNLPDYHFMVGMPYYADADELGEGDHADLIEQARSYKKGKSLVFELKLSDNRTLLGYKLGSKTAKFPKKIGTQNSAVLPYTVLIEDGKAKALAAKYYLAVSYPLLTMTEFMTIAPIPGAIEKDLSKPFKK